MAARQRVLPREISVGQPLPWDVFDAEGTLLLRRGFVIDTQRAIDRLIEEGIFLDSGIVPDSSGATRTEEKPPSALQYILDAKRLIGPPTQNLDAVQNYPERIVKAAQFVELACQAHSGVAIASILLLQEGSYAHRHPVNVSIITCLLARAMALPPPQIASLIAAALTMNVSMADIQDKLNDIKGPLNDKLRALIAAHPARSAQRLGALGVTDPLWLRCVEQHHERENGTGYPQALAGAVTEPGAKIIGLADCYCARVSVRNYKSAQQPNVAIRNLYVEQGQEIDTMAAAHLLRIVGLYPPGTIVRLRNGETAIVAEPTDNADSPVVYAVLGQNNTALNVPAVRKTIREAFNIVEVLTIEKVNFPIQMARLWGDAAKLS